MGLTGEQVYERVRRNTGWWAHARRSPQYRGWADPPFPSDLKLLEAGWEGNYTRPFDPAYEYCNGTGCFTRGGPNSSAKTWVRAFRRLRVKEELCVA